MNEGDYDFAHAYAMINRVYICVSGGGGQLLVSGFHMCPEEVYKQL